MSASILAALLLVQPVQQFDLLCIGEIKSGATGLPERVQPFSIRIHIDLNHMVWCEDACASPTPIADANSAEIVLTRHETPSRSSNLLSVSRTTGRYTGRLLTPATYNSYVFMDGQCTRAAFTPIPEAQF